METELRQLLRKIEEEYKAAYNGMYAFSSGTSRHEFINAKMENVGRSSIYAHLAAFYRLQRPAVPITSSA
jgi:hypothetical protein